MRLSEAMRLGAMMGRQLFNHLVDGMDSCAIGAVVLTIGVELSRLKTHQIWDADALRRRWPFLDAIVQQPCACAREPRPRAFGRNECDLWPTIVHLNNEHRWSRECIADWIESLEPTLDPSIHQETTAALQQEVVV